MEKETAIILLAGANTKFAPVLETFNLDSGSHANRLVLGETEVSAGLSDVRQLIISRGDVLVAADEDSDAPALVTLKVPDDLARTITAVLRQIKTGRDEEDAVELDPGAEHTFEIDEKHQLAVARGGPYKASAGDVSADDPAPKTPGPAGAKGSGTGDGDGDKK